MKGTSLLSFISYLGVMIMMCLMFGKAYAAAQSGAIQLHQLDGQVVKVSSELFSVNSGNTIYEFEREAGDKDLPASIHTGEAVHVSYQTNGDNERVGKLVVKATSRNQEAGQLGVPGKVINDDRAFYGA